MPWLASHPLPSPTMCTSPIPIISYERPTTLAKDPGVPATTVRQLAHEAVTDRSTLQANRLRGKMSMAGGVDQPPSSLPPPVAGGVDQPPSSLPPPVPW